jgi:2-keto-3-deoxy-L-rhamnonate aldolase RhmA
MSHLPSRIPVHQAAGLFRDRLKSGETVCGCFLSLGSAVTAELMGMAGYDWALIDLEHGAGGEADVLAQTLGLAASGCAAIVRVESNARQRVHRVLDFGAHGVMFPRIDTPEEARAAVASMQYAPSGVRGVAFSNRACTYGTEFRGYMAAAGTLLTIVQIESPEAVRNAEEIAAIDGVDVLFVGPTDLSHSMGMLNDFERPEFQAAVDKVAAAAARHGKWSGILLPAPTTLAAYRDKGYRFIASGSDAVLLNSAARNVVSILNTARIAPTGSRPD